MNQQDFDNLQKGDRVKYKEGIVSNGFLIEGDVIVRSQSWLDCPSTIKFVDDHRSYFLTKDQVERV